MFSVYVRKQAALEDVWMASIQGGQLLWPTCHMGRGTGDLRGCLWPRDHQWSLSLEYLISSSIAPGPDAAGTATEGTRSEPGPRPGHREFILFLRKTVSALLILGHIPRFVLTQRLVTCSLLTPAPSPPIAVPCYQEKPDLMGHPVAPVAL